MKAAPLLVSWHNENAPIYSAHFEPHGKGRLATAGGDNNVRVWAVCTAAGDLADHYAAMERGEPRRGAEGHIPLHARQAHAGRQCSPVVPARCVLSMQTPMTPLLTHLRRNAGQRGRRRQRPALGAGGQPSHAHQL
jgi:hypothetical protein